MAETPRIGKGSNSIEASGETGFARIRARRVGRLLGLLAGLCLLGGLAGWMGGPIAAQAVQPDARGREAAPLRGNPDAPVTLVEYSDFTCGFCLKFFRETWPRLRKAYVDTGKLRFLYKDYPRAPQGAGLEAAQAARCAGEQGQYWPMHDELFWGATRGGQRDVLLHAKTLRLDLAKFSACLRDGRYQAAIFQDREEGIRLGLRGTPGFLLLPTSNTSKVPPVLIPGAFPYEVFAEQIERLLKAVGPR